MNYNLALSETVHTVKEYCYRKTEFMQLEVKRK